MYKFLLDAASSGNVTRIKNLQQTLKTLLGGNIYPRLQETAHNQITRMLVAHIFLLINTYTNCITIPKEWITLPNNSTIAKEDLQQGKIVVRTMVINDKMGYINIREYIETMTLPQLEYYNIGLGTAATRTSKQKKLARKYIEKILDTSADNLIIVDGAINTKDNPKPTKQQKIEKSGYGGYGGIHISQSTNKIHHYFYNKINTNDAQETELNGINTALQLAEQITATEITMLCDCKNAVEYSNNRCRIPYKYAAIIQQIYNKEAALNRKGKPITIKWIPGHTDYEGNDIADLIAKKATKLWVNPETQVSISFDILPSLRALDGSTIRNTTPLGEAG